MPRRLVIAGIVVTGAGLGLLGYLDPAIRVLFFGPTGVSALGAATSFTRTGSFTGTFTGVPSQLAGRGAEGAASLDTVATVLAFAATVIGLLLTIAGSFGPGKQKSAGSA